MPVSVIRAFVVFALFGLTSASFGQTNVWMLVPGFTVRQLPVRLANLNNLRFTPDGRLSALGYDGRIHILLDTDGDGLEDRDTLFWDKPTLTVPVGMAWSAAGLYVSSHGKVSLLRDTNGDGKADVEEVIASGWPPTDVASGGVDATAVTLDRSGNVYFGLMAADYSNPYRVKDGISHYDLNGQRGTVQRWSASTRQLETIATGIRVPYTLAFNRQGDLFVTDQEGETWCPGGNPLDELNHIIPGRNYGFPPRQDQYLPNLISEPPVVAFGPQHQSSCGFVFNEANPRQRPFGPTWWEGDALVAGESRGKIWRVRLVKTPAGYVGKETLIARLNMLALDVAVSPLGDLYVCCHSGLPDWGTGPTGEGKIFKISYTDPRAPQPIATWASGPMQVQVVFDRPIDQAITNRTAEMKIEFGEYVSAADRLEALKPPYQAVNRQEAAPRGNLQVVAAGLSPDHRTLSLTTDPHPQSVSYALHLSDVRAPGASASPTPIDLAYDLKGVEVKWFDRADRLIPKWSGWLPHLDWNASQAFLANSAAHEALFRFVTQTGSLQLQTQIVLPKGRHKFHIGSSWPFEATIGARSVPAPTLSAKTYLLQAAIDFRDQPEPLVVTLETGSSASLELNVSYSTESDPTWRPLPLGAWLLPWAPPHQPPPVVEARNVDLAGGDFERGRDLFFGERLKCSTCHRMRGEGATVGPDLSNLVHRDAASVRRDIVEPNATINPDYVAYNILLRNGTTISGFVRAQANDAIRVTMADAKELVLPRADLKDLSPSLVSLMPTGLLDGLLESQVRDLLTFLLNKAPIRSPAEIEDLRRHDINRISPPPHLARPLHIVLVASQQDHGPGQHDYPAWQKEWAGLLGEKPGVEIADAWDWPAKQHWDAANLIVFYFWNHDWSAERLGQMDAFLDRGGGLVMLHSATIADKEPELLAARIGLAAQPGPTKYLHTPLVLQFSPSTDHPITRGFTKLDLLDEPYWPLIGDPNRVKVLATSELEGATRPLIWTYQKSKGRVFASIPGHYSWTLADPLFHTLVLRGLAWAAGEPADRLE